MSRRQPCWKAPEHCFPSPTIQQLFCFLRDLSCLLCAKFAYVKAENYTPKLNAVICNWRELGFSHVFALPFSHIQPGWWNLDEVLLTVGVLCAAVVLPTEEVPPEPAV